MIFLNRDLLVTRVLPATVAGLLLVLLAGACSGVRPAEPTGADFFSISRPGSSDQARWTEVRVSSSTGGFRTDVTAKANSPGEEEELVEVHLTIIQLRGPGEYPLGFGWDRGKSRVTLQTRVGMRCMTPSRDAGVIEITAAPVGRELAPGDRLEGRYRVHCFPEADTNALEAARVFTGAFAVTVGALPGSSG